MCKSIWNTNCIVCLHPCHFATNRKGLHELLRHLFVREEEHRLELFSLLLARLAAAPSLHHHLLVLAPVCPSLPPQRLQATRSPGSDNATASSRCIPAQYALNHASSSCCACCACLPFCVCRTAMATPHTPLAASPPNVTSTTDSCSVLASPTTYRSSPARPTTTSPISSSSAERCTTQKSYGSHGPPEPTDASRAPARRLCCARFTNFAYAVTDATGTAFTGASNATPATRNYGSRLTPTPTPSVSRLRACCVSSASSRGASAGESSTSLSTNP